MVNRKIRTKNEAPASTDSSSVTDIEVKDSLGGICRLCTTCDGIFTSVIDKRNEAIKNWIFNCLSIQIDDNDALPKTICHRCLFFLEMFQEFIEILSKKLKNPNKMNCFVCLKEADKNLTLGAPIVSRKLQICIPQFQMKKLEENTNQLCKTCYCKLDYLTDLKKKACESKLFFSETAVNSYIQANTKSQMVPTINRNIVGKKLSTVKDIVRTSRLKINSIIKRDSKMFDSVSSIVLPDIIKLKKLTVGKSYSVSNDKMTRGLKRKINESYKNKSIESSNGIWQVASSSLTNDEKKRLTRSEKKSVTNDKSVSPVMKLKKMKSEEIKTETTNKRITSKNQQKKGSSASIISLEDSLNSDDNSLVNITSRSSKRNAANVVDDVEKVTKTTNRKRKLDTTTEKDSVSTPKIKKNMVKKTKGPKSKTIKIRMSFPGLTNKLKSVTPTPYTCQYCDLSFQSTCEGKAHEMNHHNKSLKVKLNPVAVEENMNENSIEQSEHDNLEELISKAKRVKKAQSVRFSDIENSNITETHNSKDEINENEGLEKPIEGKVHEISTKADERLSEPEETCATSTPVEENCISGVLRLSVDDEQEADDIDEDDEQNTDVIEISDVDDSREKTSNKKKVKQDEVSDNGNDEDLLEIKDAVTQVDLTEDSQDEVKETVAKSISEENISEATNIVVTNSIENSESTEAANALIETQDENVQESTISTDRDSECLVENVDKNNLSSETEIDNKAEEPKKDSEGLLDINLDVNADEVSDNQQESTTLPVEIVVQSEENNSENIEKQCKEKEKSEQKHDDIDIRVEDFKVITELDIADDQVTNKDTEVIEQVVETEEVVYNSVAIEEDSEKYDASISENEEAVETEEVALESEEVAVETEEVVVDTEEVAIETEEVAIETEEVAIETEEVSGNEDSFVADEDSCNIVEVSADNEESSTVNEEALVETVSSCEENLTGIDDNVKQNNVIKDDENELRNLEDASRINITHKENGKVTKNTPHDKSLEDLIAELEN